MMTFDTDTPKTCGIVETDSEGVVFAIHEKSENPPGIKANGAVYLLEPEIIKWIEKKPETVDFSTEVQELQTGGKYYTVLAKLRGESIDVNKEDAEMLQSFLDWITNYNNYVTTSFDEKRGNHMSEEEAEIIDQIVGNDFCLLYTSPSPRDQA